MSEIAELARELKQRILVRDANLIVLDKPRGLPVHGGPSGVASVETALPLLTFGLRHVPVPAHRLDQDTSGCLVLARHPRARSRLGRLFSERLILKRYWAMVRGVPADGDGLIEMKLRKLTTPAGWRMVVDPVKGQEASTRWRHIGHAGDLTWLELQPLTGRTHQLRVHLAQMGWPIMGDGVYGRSGDPPPMHLHARRIEIPYWQDRAPVVAVAPLPASLQPGFALGGWGEDCASER